MSINSEALMTVFTGSCDKLECVRNEVGDVISDSERVRWQSEKNVLYYILVQSNVNATGVFELELMYLEENDVESPPTVDPNNELTTIPATSATTYLPTSAPSTPVPATPESPVDQSANNDVCEDAVGPLAPKTRLAGSFEMATADQVGSCGTASHGPGLWYTVKGTGAGIRVSTCQAFAMNDAQMSGVDSSSVSVSVFMEGCETLNCLIGSNDTCSVDGLVNFNTEKEEIYHVLISVDEPAGTKSFMLLHDDTQWLAQNCHGKTEQFVQQLRTLEGFFESTGNTRSSGPLHSQEWLTGCKPCLSWGGLECDEDEEVTSINLRTCRRWASLYLALLEEPLTQSNFSLPPLYCSLSISSANRKFASGIERA
jgi:hypothetical protein